jgi:hypothetical protein
MKIINFFNQPRSLTAFIIFLCTILLSACGANPALQAQVSDSESCARLQGLIKDHPNKFKNYKKTFIARKKMNIWSADKVLPSAKQCQVWEWGTGLLSYACEWPVDKGEIQAFANYKEASTLIQSCLGSAWTAETNVTQSGGKRTVYSNSSLPTVVSIRYFEDTAGWKALHSWNNTLVIGDRSNLNAPLQ